MINGQHSFVPSAQAIRKKMKENESSPQSAISEKEMAVLGPKKVLFPDKHSRELPGSYDNDLHGDRHPEGSNEVCWAADRIHLKLASSVGESYFHTFRYTA